MKNNIDTFSIAFIASIIIHLLIIYFFLFGLPLLFPKVPEEQVIVFEMLPISSKANVPNKIKQNYKALENEVAKKVVQSKAEPVEEKKPEPTPEEKPELVKDKKPEPVAEKKPEPTPEEKPEPVKESKPKPVEEKKPEPTPEEQPVEKKQIAAKKKTLDQTELDSLLKNLEQSSEGSNSKTANKARPKEKLEAHDSKGPYDANLSLSISEISLIKQQIEKHWNIPIGVQNIEQARVILYIAFNQDGSITEVTVKEAICPTIPHNACNALSDSAVRAVWKASPINNLDPKRYNIWKEFNFDFNPSKIIR
ncbi:energy transducer TonB [Candidatus Tisiphia endosymbiont of Beris chalybata]|uniref:energy transducer TonB n=1 Tax=Candidatus Tisiphia endosymbiont of Beris chalybata TaxID=3066262 RepID=UPI00312C9496